MFFKDSLQVLQSLHAVQTVKRTVIMKAIRAFQYADDTSFFLRTSAEEDEHLLYVC